jgi:hypothetical protein
MNSPTSSLLNSVRCSHDKSGGGGGNRTRVRKYYPHASTCVVSLFKLRVPVRRLTGFLEPYLP